MVSSLPHEIIFFHPLPTLFKVDSLPQFKVQPPASTSFSSSSNSTVSSLKYSADSSKTARVEIVLVVLGLSVESPLLKDSWEEEECCQAQSACKTSRWDT